MISPNEQLKLADESQRGSEARQIIANPVFADAMKQLKREIIEKWSDCPARDTEGREWLWKHYQAALRFEQIITSIMETGKMADISLEQNGLRRAMVRAANIWR